MKTTVGLTLDPDVIESIREYADKDGRTVSGAVNHILRIALEKKEKEVSS